MLNKISSQKSYLSIKHKQKEHTKVKKAIRDIRNGRLKLNLQSLSGEKSKEMVHTFTNRFRIKSSRYSPFVKNETLQDNDYYYKLEGQLMK